MIILLFIIGIVFAVLGYRSMCKPVRPPRKPVEVTKRNITIIDREPQKKEYRDYKEYLSSDVWKEKRLQTIRNAGFKCMLCGAKDKTLQVHHNTYSKWGSEKDNDLICLCADCHATYHKNKAKKIS